MLTSCDMGTGNGGRLEENLKEMLCGFPLKYIYLNRVTKQSTEEFYIKWRDVPYNLSTWENPEDHVNSQIRFVLFWLILVYIDAKMCTGFALRIYIWCLLLQITPIIMAVIYDGFAFFLK